MRAAVKRTGQGLAELAILQFAASEFHQRRSQVDGFRRTVVHDPRILGARRPDDQRHPDRAVIEVALGDKTMIAIHLSVIRGEGDDRGVDFSAFFDDAQDLADLIVDQGNAAGVIGAHRAHFARLEGRKVPPVLEHSVNPSTWPRQVAFPLSGLRHRLGIVHARIGFRGVPGLVRTAPTDPAEPGFVPVIGGQVPLGLPTHIDVVVVLQRQNRGANDVRLVGRPLA